jgi:hypothetical protein
MDGGAIYRSARIGWVFFDPGVDRPAAVFCGGVGWGLARLAFASWLGYALPLGVDGYAAVPRCGLGPLPPLCRYAVHTKRQGSASMVICGGKEHTHL